MDFKRLWRTVRIFTIFSGKKRTEYIRRSKIFACFGENSTMSSRIIPLYPELISIGNNVRLAAKVSLIPHDMIHAMLNHWDIEGVYREYVGCIKIDNNVFVGANTTILADVHIESNIIIGAGSLVNRDLKGGNVYAGIPVKKICTFNDFVEKRKTQVYYPESFRRIGDSIGPDFSNWLWNDFEKRHQRLD